MEKIEIIRPTAAECIEQIEDLTSRYGETEWIVLFSDPSRMSEEDREEFTFLCETFWSLLIRDTLRESDSPPGQQVGDMSATEEPGVYPGFAVFAG